MTKVNKPDSVKGGAKAQKAAPTPPKPTAAEIADKKLQAWHCECRKKAQDAEATAALNFKMPQGASHISQTPRIGNDCYEYLMEHNKAKKNNPMKNWSAIEEAECREAAKLGPINKKPPTDKDITLQSPNIQEG